MSEVIKIGKTNYYSVRKGAQNYRVAEGKKLTDADYCWQILKDQDSGKMFFLNRSGVRRWHLPDIYITDKERQEEERELKFRRERKAAEEARAAKGTDDGADDASGAADEKRDEGLAGRDAAAAQLKMLREWDSVEARKPVIKFAKTVLAPFFSQGLLDNRNFQQTISTGVKEFCASKSKLGDGEKQVFKKDLESLAQARIDEINRKEEFEKMNEDLLERVRRMDTERRNLNTQIDVLTKSEEKLKEENFGLRAHKQDVLLHSFKRLTRAGLTQAYWTRWIKYKSIVDAQLHVRAREQRALQMTERISTLEEQLNEKTEQCRRLQERVQRSEGRDVIAMMLSQAGMQTMSKFFIVWKRFAQEATREREFFNVRQQLADCPHCKLRETDTERVRQRLNEVCKMLAEVTEDRNSMEEEKNRLGVMLDAAREMESAMSTMSAEAQFHASDLSKKLAITRDDLKRSEDQVRFLRNDIDKMNFESADFSGAGGAIGTGGGGGGYQRGSPMRERQLRHRGPASPNVSAVNHSRGARPTPGEEGILHRFEVTGEDGVQDPTNIASFWQSDSRAMGSKVEQLMMSRLNRTEEDAEVPRGVVLKSTEAALAPDVRGGRPAMRQQQSAGSPSRRENIQSYRQQERSPSPPPPPTPTDSDSDDSASSVSLDMDQVDVNDPIIHTRGDSDDDRPPSESPPQDRSPSGPRMPSPKQPTPKKDEDPYAEDGMRCEKCGFRKNLAPFCPKDGSRHLFASYAQGFRDPKSGVNLNFDVVTRSTSTKNRDAVVHGGKIGEKEMKQLGLPPGRATADGEQPIQQNANVVEVGSRVQALRDSLNLNPQQYSHARLVNKEGPMAARPSYVEDSDYREVADYIRKTHIATQRNAAFVEPAGSALSMDSTLFTGDRQNPAASPGRASASNLDATSVRDRDNAGSWGKLFNYGDVTDGSLGVVAGTTDKLYGVYRNDQRPAVPPSRELVQEQQSTPSLRLSYPTH